MHIITTTTIGEVEEQITKAKVIKFIESDKK